MRDLADVYAAKGKQVLEKCADEDPRTFIKAIVALCPKQIDATVSPLDGLEDSTLMGLAHALQAYRQARAQSPADGTGASNKSDAALSSDKSDETL